MNLFDLSGRTALVTGSSRGIGKAILLGLARQSADVIVHCANNIDLARTVAGEAAQYGVRALAIQSDLADAEGPQRLADAVMQQGGGVDILVLNASAQIDGPLEDFTQADFDRQMTVNVRASLELMRFFLPAMAGRQWGRILTVGSVQQIKPHPRTMIYAASKDAQMSLVRNLAKQCAAQGVTVNNLAPGFIATDRNAGKMADASYLANVLGRIPAGKIGQPEDCVGAALLLCSDAGQYITGVNLVVDGGMHL